MFNRKWERYPSTNPNTTNAFGDFQIDCDAQTSGESRRHDGYVSIARSTACCLVVTGIYRLNFSNGTVVG